MLLYPEFSNKMHYYLEIITIKYLHIEMHLISVNFGRNIKQYLKSSNVHSEIFF